MNVAGTDGRLASWSLSVLIDIITVNSENVFYYYRKNLPSPLNKYPNPYISCISLMLQPSRYSKL